MDVSGFPGSEAEFRARFADEEQCREYLARLKWQEGFRCARCTGDRAYFFYGYSRFCQLYRAWEGKLPVTMRQHHLAGEKLFVDYAGQTVAVIDLATGRRATVETLAALKNPPAAVFARQANIAHGPQQVNNGGSAGPTGNPQLAQNELLELQDGERLDTGTAGAAGASGAAMATVGARDWPTHC